MDSYQGGLTLLPSFGEAPFGPRHFCPLLRSAPFTPDYTTLSAYRPVVAGQPGAGARCLHVRLDYRPGNGLAGRFICTIGISWRLSPTEAPMNESAQRQ